MGPPGVNAGIVVWLYPGTAVGVTAPQGAGRTDGVLVEGSFTAANLTGALTGQPLSALITAMENGNAYLNFHTSDGVKDSINCGDGNDTTTDTDGIDTKSANCVP